MTELCGIALHPAGHTLSPVLHKTAYLTLGLKANYHVFDLRPEEFPNGVKQLRQGKLRQLSVSLPHKEAALNWADEITPAARAIGAANTLTRIDGRIVAENTDWIGAQRSLESHQLGSRALVLGAGGAARGIVYALLDLGLEIGVHNRSPERAQRLIEDLGGHTAQPESRYDLLVNATSVGMSPDHTQTPIAREHLRPGALVFDAVYRPLETRLLREAREAGCHVQDGLDMLIHQAIEQIRIWSGRTADATELRAAALAALN